MRKALEVGNLIAGTTEGSSSYWWAGRVNSVGGIGVKHDLYNASEKSMKYVTFVYIPYNQVGDAVASSTTGEIEARGKLTGPINPNEKTTVKWEVLWYNPTITEVKLKEVIIQYMDDTKETINGDEILNIEDENSVYYEKRGKEETAERQKLKAEREENIRKAWQRRAYLSFMVLTCLKEAKKNDTIKFHANQGLLLFILEILAIVLRSIPFVGGFISLVLFGVAIAFSVKGIYDIYNNKQNEIPFIGKFKLLK